MSDDVVVQLKTQRIIVEPTSRTVSVISSGPQGPAGPAGDSVPAGGTTGQVLTKDSVSDGDVSWQTPAPPGEATNGLPDGGVTGQLLAKVTGTDYDAGWISPTSAVVPPGGTTDQVLKKVDGTDYNTAWTTPVDTNTLGPDGDKGDITVGGTGTTLVIDADSVLTGKIADDQVTNAKLANVSTATFKGRSTAGTGDPEDMSATAATALLNAFTSSLKGLAPASGGGTTTYLRADGTWVAPSAVIADGDKGDIVVSSTGTVWTIDNDVVTLAKMLNIATARILGRITGGTGDIEELTGTQLTTLLDAFTSSLKGLVPASGGGSANYLRADGTWAAPVGTGSFGPLVFTVPGALTVAAGVKRLYVGKALTVANITAGVNTAPTGASILVDVNKNGTTMFTTQGNRPTIAASGFSDAASVPDVTSLAAGDYITIDVDQIGSTIAGSNLVVSIELV